MKKKLIAVCLMALMAINLVACAGGGKSVKITQAKIPGDYYYFGFLDDDTCVCYDELLDEDGTDIGDVLYFYNFDGDLLCTKEMEVAGDEGDKPMSFMTTDGLGTLIWMTRGENVFHFHAYEFKDNDLVEKYETDIIPENYEYTKYGTMLECDYGYVMYEIDGMKFAYDNANNCICDPDDVPYSNGDYDESLWCCYTYEEAIDGYLVGTADGTRWGYYDKDGNEIAMYEDATEFSANGYALVCNDGRAYDVIDTDFNVVKKDAVKGIGAAASYVKDSAIFDINQVDGSIVIIKVE